MRCLESEVRQTHRNEMFGIRSETHRNEMFGIRSETHRNLPSE